MPRRRAGQVRRGGRRAVRRLRAARGGARAPRRTRGGRCVPSAVAAPRFVAAVASPRRHRRGVGLRPLRGADAAPRRYHVVRPGGGLFDPQHVDAGSLVTVDVLLEDAFEGGAFRTPEANGRVASHDRVFKNKGDLVCFLSLKRHHVDRVVAGERRGLVLEFCRAPCAELDLWGARFELIRGVALVAATSPRRRRELPATPRGAPRGVDPPRRRRSPRGTTQRRDESLTLMSAQGPASSGRARIAASAFTETATRSSWRPSPPTRARSMRPSSARSTSIP